MKNAKFLTEGPVLKALLIVALPIIVSNLLQNVLELVDIYFIGHLGESAAAAGTTSASVIMLLLVLILGINTATAAFTARAYGSGKHERIQVILGHALYLTLAISLIIGLVGVFCTEQIFGLFGSSPDVTEQGVKFLQPLLIGMFILVILMVLTTVFQSSGDSKTPMFVMIIVNLINIGLNPSLINGYLFFPELGIAGSAYATLISRSIGVVLLILAMYLLPSAKRSPIKFPKKWTFEPRLLRDLALIGLPSAVQSGLRSFAFVGMTKVITLVGLMMVAAGTAITADATVAAYGTCARLDMMGFILVMGLCVGVSVMVGQNLGADKPERATAAAKYAIIINALFMFILGLVYFFFATPLLQFFGATGEWLTFGEQFMHIVPWSYAIIAIGMTMGFAMNGAGATRPGMYAALVGMIGVQVGGSLFCVMVLGLDISSIWFCIFISAFFTAGIDTLFFLRGKWKKQKLNLGT